MKYTGFVDYGNIVPDDTEELASEALVFMLVGLRSHWKCPVGYFLINKIEAEHQASLIRICLGLAADYSLRLRVWSVTCDGTATNRLSLEILGCKLLSAKFDGFKISFKHPTRDYQVYATLDACHVLKLARNALGDLHILKDSEGQEISWHFLQQLSSLQDKEGFYLANKLTSHHIQYTQNKMKVKLAAQTLSSSAADALQFLKSDLELPSFQDCDATIQFIRVVDRMFDFLNSRHSAMKGFKEPINHNNFSRLRDQVTYNCNYLLGLKSAEGHLLVHHRRKMFIIGFVTTCKSLLLLSEELLNKSLDPFKFVLTYKFSQNHIEILFSCIRARGGFNNNPNCSQFKSALKQILMHNSISPGNKGNVLSFEKAYNGSIFSLKNSNRNSPSSEILNRSFPDNEKRCETNRHKQH